MGDEDGVGFDQADQQIEDIWGAEVIERTADRAIKRCLVGGCNSNRVVGGKAAIYAILLEKRGDFAGPITIIVLIAIVLAAATSFCCGDETFQTQKCFMNLD